MIAIYPSNGSISSLSSGRGRPASNGGSTMSATARTQGIHHAGLTVPDLAAARAFFEQALGFRPVGEVPAYPAVFLSDGAVLIRSGKPKTRRGRCPSIAGADRPPPPGAAGARRRGARCAARRARRARRRRDRVRSGAARRRPHSAHDVRDPGRHPARADRAGDTMRRRPWRAPLLFMRASNRCRSGSGCARSRTGPARWCAPTCRSNTEPSTPRCPSWWPRRAMRAAVPGRRS